MARATYGINLTDFRGGLNLRANEFSLEANESPDMLNVEVDPRGGVATRKGWEKWNSSDVTADAWNPRHSFIHELSDGTDIVMVTNNSKVLYSTAGSFSELELSAGVPVTVAAGTHLADFAPWGDKVYGVAGESNNAFSWTGTGFASPITGINSGTDFVDDYTTPGANVRMPRSRFIAAHGGKMWVAYTTESGTTYPYRVRWSHPNEPERWSSLDYVDISEGGGPITAIVAHEDHLLVFKQTSVWAIYGYSNEDQQIVNVTRSVGCYSRETVCTSENSVYFMSWPQGVYRLSGGQVLETSESLRPMLDSVSFVESELSKVWLGWMNRRLWWSVPYWEDGAADDARSIFVLDPSLGSWTKFRTSTGYGLGPYAAGGHSQSSIPLLGFCRCGPNVVEVEARETATDTISGTAVGFASRFTTPWLYDNTPELKKRWKRPTFLARKQVGDYRLQCSVYRDYDEGTVKRKFGVSVANGGSSVLYDDGVLYDSDAEYGAAGEGGGTQIQRTSSLGSAVSVQLQIDGEALGDAWGIDGIVFKFKPRRFT